MDVNYLKIIKQLGIVFKNLSITLDEYRELVKEIDAGRNNFKNSKKMSGSIEKLINLKKDLRRSIITEKFFYNEKNKLLEKIKNNI
jgi:hypothetical protein